VFAAGRFRGHEAEGSAVDLNPPRMASMSGPVAVEGAVPEAEMSRGERVVGAVAVGAAAVAWWPAFTLGAWGAVFFEQVLALWAAATAALVVVLMRGSSRRTPWPVTASLLIPSVWLALTMLPVAEAGTPADFMAWTAIAFTTLGVPYLLVVLLRIASPGSAALVDIRHRAAAGIAVLLVVVLAYLLGTQHPRILTCEDFTISGNSQPDGCTPGDSILQRP
jgi:hypothetical protein